MTIEKIAIGSDHAGFDLKENLKQFLSGKGYALADVGPASHDSVDYPDYAESVSIRVARGDADLGVLVCGTGLGMTITANKIQGIRAALLYDAFAAHYAKAHNDANVVIFGGRTISPEDARKYLGIFLKEKFEGGRHKKRLDKIAKIESRITRVNGGR
ncbi:MAG: ribose 5-phosphate isomerase B [Deltaproteobacteria bacterium]|nr:ribose 5-phosphate isomerase B [Deltaproteobacteria bacterium]NIS78158.1 ribose 5-phosphate isomerase B [Deltaproteobacteria bacterium]